MDTSELQARYNKASLKRDSLTRKQLKVGITQDEQVELEKLRKECFSISEAYYDLTGEEIHRKAA